MMPRQKHTAITAAAFSLLFCLMESRADESDSEQSAITSSHSVEFASRSRLAYVDSPRGDGQSGSILLRLTLSSDWNDALSSIFELDHVTSFFKDDHSDGVRLNGKPLIPDAPGADLNQFLLIYKQNHLGLTLGRQRIEYDNQRFIGSANFWQNEQTFDAINAELAIKSGSRFNYAYIANANRIFGDKAEGQTVEDNNVYYSYPLDDRPVTLLGDHKHDTHLFRFEFNEWDYFRWIPYLYLIDNKDAPALSNNTLGSRSLFSYRADLIRYRAELEAAIQELHTLDIQPRPGYFALELGLGYKTVELVARHETLDSNRNTGFVTPLASAYRFQGAAGIFVVTPATGITDNSLGINWRPRPWRIDASFHTFNTDGQKLGREFDIDIIYQADRRHKIMLRYADFQSSDEAIYDSQQKIYLDYSFNL
jgi:hypothetical protein